MNIYSKCIQSELETAKLYDIAISKFCEDPRMHLLCSSLHAIRDHHRDAAIALSGVSPENSSPSPISPENWSALQNELQNAANLQGCSDSAVAILDSGESYCRLAYNDLLQRDDVENGVKDLVKLKLLRQVETHCGELSEALVLAE